MKGREKDKPMVLLIPGQAWVDLLVRDVPDPARKLTEAFWPGPLTIVFRTGAKALEKCPWLNQTVALRRTAHPFTSRVLRELDLPIVSTSINRSGRPVPPDPLKYLEKLARRKKSTPELIPELAVIDQKLQDSGSYPSTIVRVVDEETVQVIRHGALSAEIIAERAGIKVVDTL
jgi:L-threonylcarbamoyladenylate synthase